uniref:Transmembrane protein n=1 Tax=Marseillevirus LCMAC101 TaxID=2506602 RepID=A0A481YQX3_9VIRU|nr:MAG: hypothetical protein LCMAC101_02260 [Marseillevirus LCMAC101]
MVEILGMDLTDPVSHDSQHYMASMTAMITGLAIFVTWYFFSRVESQARGGANTLPWEMPWWYFVVGGILAAFVASSIACMLSLSIRPREITIKKA